MNKQKESLTHKQHIIMEFQVVNLVPGCVFSEKDEREVKKTEREERSGGFLLVIWLD